MLTTGLQAPDFELGDEQGQPVKLSSLRGKNVLLVFYPGDETPVCTNQLCDYRDGWSQFQSRDVSVLGINPATVESHLKFQAKHSFPFPLLSDPGNKVCEAYDAVGLFGTTKRKIVLIDRDGVVKHVHEEFLSMFRRSTREILEIIDREISRPNSTGR